MDSPYRSSPLPRQVDTPRDIGIIGDVIHQFADPLAFYRELVQNSIDSDTDAIEVALTYDQQEGVVIVSVRDQGEGMDRHIIEDRLLVLFRSTKENDPTKIGKFGVGFVSVLAVGPRIVRIHTARAGAGHTVHLYPDMSYELFDTGPRSRTGTSVELEIPMGASTVDGFVARSLHALRSWCRHATIPLTFTARGPTLAAREERINEPLALEGALVEVSGRSEDGKTALVVGLLKGARPFAGFYNSGLTLLETPQALVGQLAFKVQDPRLGHTLSRDNVRRDGSFRRALARVEELAARMLPQAVARGLTDAADQQEPTRYRDLLVAALAAGIELPAEQWNVPLLEPIGGKRYTDLAALEAAGAWSAEERSPITARLAEMDLPVLDRRALPPEQARRLGTVDLVDVDLTLVTPLDPSPAELLLADEVRAFLDAGHRAPPFVLFARLFGARRNALAIALSEQALAESAGGSVLVDPEGADRDLFVLWRRPVLVLNADHPQVASARACAESEPVYAAALLARLVLFSRQALGERGSSQLTELGIDKILGGRR